MFIRICRVGVTSSVRLELHGLFMVLACTAVVEALQTPTEHVYRLPLEVLANRRIRWWVWIAWLDRNL